MVLVSARVRTFMFPRTPHQPRSEKGTQSTRLPPLLGGTFAGIRASLRQMLLSLILVIYTLERNEPVVWNDRRYVCTAVVKIQQLPGCSLPCRRRPLY